MRLQKTSLNYFHSSFRHYYLCHYLPLSAGKDMISRSLLKFKHRIPPDFNTWIEDAGEALDGISPSPDTIILRVLHHDETTAATVFPTALDFLGHALAARFGCRYLPSLLRKSRSARPCKELSRRQRKSELRGIYSVDPTVLQTIPPQSAEHSALHPADPAAPTPAFLLIDDILTTGTTLRMIIRPLQRSFPLASIQIFTLARADYDPKLPLRDPELPKTPLPVKDTP